MNPLALGQNLASFLFNGAGLIIATVVLRSGIFSKVTAHTGILFGAFTLGFPLGVALAAGSTVIPGAA